MSFVIAPFPDEAEKLKEDWATELELILGPSRAEIFALYAINGPTGPHGSIPPLMNWILGLWPRGMDWTRYRTNETRITVIFTSAQTNADRVIPSRTQFYFEGGSGSGFGSPNRWPHLITPEILAARP